MRCRALPFLYSLVTAPLSALALKLLALYEKCKSMFDGR